MNRFFRFLRRLNPNRVDGAHARLLAAMAATAAIALSVAAPAHAQPDPIGDATPEQLKLTYLACEERAAAEPLDAATAQLCSVFYEALKSKVFGGSYDALLAWWQAERRVTLDSGADEYWR